MIKPILLCAGLCAMALVVAANDAQATGSNQVSYVSNTGSDSNGCTNPTTDACATFSGALTNTASNGEIDCVNAGHYGDVFVIQQSVTIDCAGAVGFTAGQILVNGAGIVVRLRNLSINGGGDGHYGITGVNVAALYVENCVITNYNAAVAANPPYYGIHFDPSANAQLFVTNSIISNDGSGGVTGGIYIVPASSVTANVVIDGSQINGNVFGIVGDGRQGGIVRGTIKNSVVSGSTENGVTALSSGSSVLFMLDQTEVTGNGAAGLFASGSGAGILARNTSVFKNGIGLDAASGAGLVSYGNNSVAGNTTNGAFTATVSQQ